MDQCRSRLTLSENFERHWSILISGKIHDWSIPFPGEIRMDQWFGIPWTWYRSISGLRPEMGTKMAEQWFLASPEKWGKNGPENEKIGPENGKIARKWLKMEFRPILQVRPKSIFRPFSSPFRARGPKWGSIPGPRDSNQWS